MLVTIFYHKKINVGKDTILSHTILLLHWKFKTKTKLDISISE